MKVILISLLFLNILFVCNAQTKPYSYGPWHSCKIGGGGYIQNVVLSATDPKRMYAYVDVGGLYRSDDGGHRWRMLQGNFPFHPGGYEVRSLLVDPRNDSHLIAAVGSQWTAPYGILVSSDAGKTWHQTLTASFWGNGDYRWCGVLLARSPKNPNTIYAAAVDTGVWMSKDNGETWINIGAKGYFPTDLKIDRVHPATIYLCALPEKGWWQNQQHDWRGGFLRSDNSGKTWRKISEDSPSEILQDPQNASNWYGIFKNKGIETTSDKGANWRLFSDGLPLNTSPNPSDTDDGSYNAMAAGPDFILTASAHGAFYKLRCGQTHWRKIDRKTITEIYEGEEWFRGKSGSAGSALGSIIVDPRNPKHWFFTDWYAIYQTMDSGVTWNLTINGIEVTVVHCLTQDPSNDNRIFLGMADNGYFYSNNRGDRFYNIDWTNGISNNIKCIAISAADSSRVYAVGPQTWDWVANQVFISTDHGHKFTKSPEKGLPDMTTHHCDSIAADPQNAMIVYLAVSGRIAPGNGGVYRSDDGGDTWKWMSDGLPSNADFFAYDIWNIGTQIALDGKGNILCISMANNSVYSYNGATGIWHNVTPTGAVSIACLTGDPAKKGNFYLAANGVYVTRNNGKSWKKTLNEDAAHIAVDIRHPERIAAGIGDGVMLSVDSGMTWKRMSGQLPNRIDPIPAFCGNQLLVGTGGNGAFWMDISAYK